MQNFLAELLGTMLLVILGDGVVANVVLNRTKGQNSGWIVITVGWGVAVAMAVYAVGRLSGAHLNPAVTVALAATGSFSWAEVPSYVAAQIIGTAVLLFGILAIAANAQTLSKAGDVDLTLVFSRGLQPLLVGVLVLGIGVSLGGPTGYAINPARDLGPRLAHALLPIPGKGGSDWEYAWIPIIGPLIGGVLGAGLYAMVGF